jgi:hypothetical protein
MIVSSLAKEDANELYPIIGRLGVLPGDGPRKCPSPIAKNWETS